ncbi:MAG: TIGR02757 family protein [bacterium]
MKRLTKGFLEKLYRKYNRKEFVHPDPLEFLYNYDDPLDREIAGMVASSLAYGRVHQIIKSVAKVLDRMSPSPRLFLKKSSASSTANAFSAFKHRFTTGGELSSMLMGIKKVIKKHGSLQGCFLEGLGRKDETVLPALCSFISEITGSMECGTSLLPIPGRQSAFKRLNLFLRWMVRKDAVDPGGWNNVSPSRLIIPLDIHMHRIGLTFGMTSRKQGDIRTALDITEALRKICPADPVKYDFCLTRTGIKVEGRKISLPAS